MIPRMLWSDEVYDIIYVPFFFLPFGFFFLGIRVAWEGREGGGIYCLGRHSLCVGVTFLAWMDGWTGI